MIESSKITLHISAICPAAFVSHGSWCFHIGLTENNWEDSQTYCEDISGLLVDLPTQQKTNAARAFAISSEHLLYFKSQMQINTFQFATVPSA